MKNKTKKYNWHFWLPQYKMQVVIEETCFSRAKNKTIDIFCAVWKNPKIEFQFGELIQ